jgi:hypothetical protein
MATEYTALAAKLAGAAKDHLVNDQVRWLGNRSQPQATAPRSTTA